MCSLTFIASNEHFRILIQSFQKALRLISIHRRGKNWLTVRAISQFLVSSSFYDRSSLLCFFHMWYIVMSNTCYIFFALILLHSYCQFATNHVFVSSFSVKLSNPILLHWRTIPHLFTLPNCTTPNYISKLYPFFLQCWTTFSHIIESNKNPQAL